MALYNWERERGGEEGSHFISTLQRCGTVHAGVSSPDFHAPCVGVFSRQSPSLLRLIWLVGCTCLSGFRPIRDVHTLSHGPREASCVYKTAAEPGSSTFSAKFGLLYTFRHLFIFLVSSFYIKFELIVFVTLSSIVLKLFYSCHVCITRSIWLKAVLLNNWKIIIL